MNEGQPFNPVQQPLPEQQMPMTNGSNESLAADTALSPDQPHEGEENRWDKQKAETLSAIQTQEDSTFNDAFDEFAEREERIDNNIFPSITSEARDGVEEAKLEVTARKEHLESQTPPMGLNDYRKEMLDAAEKNLDAAKEQLTESEAEAHRRIEASHAENMQNRESRIEAELSSFEKLYDMSPDAFASMPTSEFMKVAKDLRKIDRKIERVDNALNEAESVSARIDTSITEKQPMNEMAAEEQILPLIKAVWDESLGIKFEDFCREQIREEVSPIYTDTFNKSPHDILNSVKAVVDKYTPQLQERQVRQREEREKFLGQYLPKES